MMSTHPISAPAVSSHVPTVDVGADTPPITATVTWRRFARQSALWALCMIGGVASACVLYAVATQAEANRAEPQTQTGYFADLSPRR